MILADSEMEVSSESLLRVLKAANITVKPQWPMLFSNFMAGKNPMELLTSIRVGSGKAAAPAAAAVVEEKPKEKTPEEEVVGAGGMFGGSSSSEDESSSS